MEQGQQSFAIQWDAGSRRYRQSHRASSVNWSPHQYDIPKILGNMRATAKYSGKAVPSKAELEAMIPDRMICPSCQRTMRWQTPKGESRASSVSLQHWPNGTMSIICFSCNRRLGSGDTLPPLGYKWCHGCQTVFPTERFSKNRLHTFDGLNGTCKSCDAVREKKRAPRNKK